MRDAKLEGGKFEVDAPLVERLIATQFPQWAGLPVREVENAGWDNRTFHLGDRLKARLPSGMGYAEQAEKEARWLPVFAPQLPLPVPVPVGVGRPTNDYPCSWAVYEWLEGEPTTHEGLRDPVQFAQDLADFIAALQRIDPTGGPPPGPHNYFRGALVMDVYGDEARRCIDKVAGVIDAQAAHAVLDDAQVATCAKRPVWIHGDLAISNLLLREGRLAAVIDFGCCAVGDPACDLVIAWVFLEGAGREAFRRAALATEAMWARARGWALWKAALLLANRQVVNPNENSPKAVIEAVIAEHRLGR